MGYCMTGSSGYYPGTVFLNVAKVFITSQVEGPINKPTILNL
jgi:hypothetical protein